MKRSIKQESVYLIHQYDLAKENFVNYRMEKYKETKDAATSVWHAACFVVLNKNLDQVIAGQMN